MKLKPILAIIIIIVLILNIILYVLSTISTLLFWIILLIAFGISYYIKKGNKNVRSSSRKK